MIVVDLKYPNDITWIKFDVYERSRLFDVYAYQISDDRINKALSLLENDTISKLVISEIKFDWQDAILLTDTLLIPEDLKHAIRIALLSKYIKNNVPIQPVSIDTYSRAVSHLEGHHRLLALKYLGHKEFPCYLSGVINVLEEELEIRL